LIYSRWLPDRGGYEYYSSSERRGLGDDMPIPRLIAANHLGVPSIEAGRSSVGALRRVGIGSVAKGAILPMSRRGLSGVTTLLESVPTWILIASGITLGWLLRGHYRK